MKKYVLKQGIRGVFSIENDEKYDVIDYFSTHIDWPYFLEEPGTFTFIDKDGKKNTIDVKANSILLKFYPSENYPHDFVIVDSPEWVENIKAAKEAALKRAEKACEEANIGDAPAN